MAVRWITEADVLNPTDPKSAFSVEAASWILYKLTGEKYPGITTRTEWYGLEDGQCRSCIDLLEDHRHVFYRSSQQEKIRLRGTPVVSVESVTQGGALLTSADYWIHNSMYLTRVGAKCWDLKDGLEIVYTSGIRPPEAGRLAAVRLANEFILAESNSAACALPDRVTSVSRQGVDYTILDPQDFLENGRTGIYEIDLFIKAANPIGAKKKPRVFSPDMPSGATRR